MSEQKPAAEIAAKTMLGDLMKIVVDLAKALPKPWQQMGEREQDSWLATVDRQCAAAVEQCVKIIGAEGRVAVKAILKRVVFGGDVQAVLGVERTSNHRIDLADAAGQEVLLVMTQVESYITEQGKPRAEADQRHLELEASRDEKTTTDEQPAQAAAVAPEDPDPYFEDAERVVISTRRSSPSHLQRALRIGYNRALKLLVALEKSGVVSAEDDKGQRQVLKPAS